MLFFYPFFFCFFFFFFFFSFFPLLVIICLQKLRLLTAGSASIQSTLLREHKLHSAPSRSQTGQMCAAGETGSVDGRNTAVTQASGKRGSQRGQNKSSHSPANSSDSAHSQHNHTHRGRNSRHQRKYAQRHVSLTVGAYIFRLLSD